MTVSWSIKIDWNNDNFATSYDEAAYTIGFEVGRGIPSKALVTTSGNGFETIAPGQGTITLDNHTGRFDPDNAAGALYGKILPGRKFKATCTYSGTTYPVMAGIIYAIPPITDPEQRQVQLSVRGMLQLLDRNITPPALHSHSIADTAAYLLTQAALPSDYIGTIDTDPQQVTSFSPDSINALQTLQDLAAAALGQIVEKADGTINFYWRGHSFGSAIGIDQEVVGKNIVRNMPWESARNWIEVLAHTKTPTNQVIIWQNSASIKCQSFVPMRFMATFQEAINISVLSCKANQYADGSGLDWTGNIVASIINSWDTKAEIVLVNTWVGTTLYVPASGLTLLGTQFSSIDLPAEASDDVVEAPGGSVQVYKNTGAISVAYGTPVVENITFVASDSSTVQVFSCIANQYADGSGIDWSGDVTAALSSITSSSATVTLTNIYAGTLYVTELTIVANPTVAIANGLATVFTLDNPWMQDYNHALYFAKIIKAFLANPNQTVEIVIHTRPDLQYSFDIMQAISWTAATLYGSSTPVLLHAGYIAHKWLTPNGQSVDTTVVIMPRLTDGATIANDSELPTLPYIPPVPVPPTIPGTTGVGAPFGWSFVFAPVAGSSLAGYIEVPKDFNCTINQVSLYANAAGSIVVDIAKGSYSGFPTGASICASAKPILSSAQKYQDETLTGWTKSLSGGDVLAITYSGLATITLCTLALSGVRV